MAWYSKSSEGLFLLPHKCEILTSPSEVQNHGIWAYDCASGEEVLVTTFVLALLGDNPMQSEFACHIGLRGRYYCRVCMVHGKEHLHADVADEAGEDSDAEEDVVEQAEMDSMVARAQRAMEVC